MILATIAIYCAAGLGVCGIAGCAVLVWREYRDAPEGYETRDGFHAVPRHDNPFTYQ